MNAWPREGRPDLQEGRMAGPPHRSWSVIAASGRWREDWTRNPCDDDDREHCGTGKLVRVAQAVAPTLTDVIRSAPRPANPMSPTPASERCAQIATSSNSSAVQEPGALRARSQRRVRRSRMAGLAQRPRWPVERAERAQRCKSELLCHGAKNHGSACKAQEHSVRGRQNDRTAVKGDLS